MKKPLYLLTAIGTLLLVGAGCAATQQYGVTTGENASTTQDDASKTVDSISVDEQASADTLDSENADASASEATNVELKSYTDSSYDVK